MKNKLRTSGLIIGIVQKFDIAVRGSGLGTRSLYCLRMRMYFIQFRCSPIPNSENIKKYSGAFINCWIKCENKNLAIELAKKQIKEYQWKIENLEEAKIITKNFYNKDSEAYSYYNQALLDGQHFVIHTWERIND